MNRFILAFLLGGAALPSLANAAIPGALEIAKSSGLTVVKSFPAVAGLTGYVTLQEGEYAVMYGTTDGHLIAGALISPKGENLTAAHADKHVPKPNLESGFVDIQAAPAIVTGPANAKQRIYVFFDPECSFCQVLHSALAPYTAAGLGVNWIPVGMLGPKSAEKAAALLSAKSSAALMAQSFKNKGSFKYEVKDITAKAAGSVMENGQLMESLQLNGTPVIVHRDKGMVRVKQGMPRLSELPSITGLPAQKHPEPELARFK